MKKLLTKRKAAWVDKRKPEMIEARAIAPPAAVEARYYAALAKLIERMASETETEIRKLFKTEHAQEFFATDASTASQARILTNMLMKKFQTLFNVKAGPMADAFATQSNAASSASVHMTLKQLSGGLSLGTRQLDNDMRQVLVAITSENAFLIKSIPQQFLMGVQGAVMRSITTGNGLADLLPYIQKHKGITYKRARFIAMDQTRKASTALCRGRLEKHGLTQFKWLHTGGGSHPRRLHQEMSGKIYRFDDPPIIQKAEKNQREVRGFPGDLPGCRCRMQAVLKFD